MHINKFKKIGKSKYKIFFDNTDITLYEDIILKYDLLLKKDIDVDLLDEIINENKFYDSYYIALSYIEIKMRNKKEIIKYLSGKGFSDNEIDYTINKLENLNLLNNSSYIKAYVNDKINLSNDGPFKIRNSLIELGFDEVEIDNYINSFGEDIWSSKIEKLINKKKSLMKSKSEYMFITKVKNDLYNMGYSRDMIDKYLSCINYESNAIDKEFEKAFRKFKGDKNKVVSSLLRKGYSYDEINSKFRE